MVDETEHAAKWGGTYSIFKATDKAGPPDNGLRARFAKELTKIDAILLELAATAAYLKTEGGYDEPWKETHRRKPDKASKERLEAAKQVFRDLRGLQEELRTPKQLPDI